jgi:hypothetical protein
MRELEQLRKKQGGRFFNRWLRDSRRKRELNALQFNLEIVLASMVDNLKDGLSKEVQQRGVFHVEAPSGAATNARVVDVLQAQRRAVSRPASQL